MIVVCHELDRRRVESNEALAEERDDLRALTRRVDAALGPFPDFMSELGATAREAAH
jgi:hypothetical protein